MHRVFSTFVLSVLVVYGARGGPYIDVSLLKEGDIIFQESVSEQARAIQLATHSRYTHAGVLFRYGGRLRVLEAVQPVKVTDFNVFIGRGVNRHFVVKRLKDRDSLIDDAVVREMKRVGNSHIGKNYDIYFEWSDGRMYCTELIWKVYKRALGVEIGTLQKLKDFDLRHPYVKNLMKRRYGSRIPYDEPVISPESMFAAESLETVMSR